MKKKVLVSFFNTQNIGGPNKAMGKLMNSYLSTKYEFVPFYINDHLGKVIRIKVLRQLMKTFKKENPDVIYFTGMQLHGFYVSLAATLSGYKHKTIMVVRGSSCDALDFGKFKKFIFRHFIEAFTVRNSAVVHTVCTEMANNPIITKNCRNFGGVIYNVAPPKIEVFQSSFRSEINAGDNEILAVYTGRIVDDKGISYLINALPKVDKRCRMIFVGDGNLEKYMALCDELNVTDRVMFLGKREDVPSILSGCDVFVFPTLHENLSNSLLEACTYGLPVVATNVGGNPEVIRNGIDGFLVPPADSYALAQAINELVQNNKLRKEMGKKAEDNMKGVFSARTVYEKIDELFLEIIS